MHVATAVVVVGQRRVAAGLLHGIDGRLAVARIGCGVRMVVIVVLVVVRRGRRILIGHPWELHRVLDPVTRIDHAIALQRDHDGDGEADAELADESRQ